MGVQILSSGSLKQYFSTEILETAIADPEKDFDFLEELRQGALKKTKPVRHGAKRRVISDTRLMRR